MLVHSCWTENSIYKVLRLVGQHSCTLCHQVYLAPTYVKAQAEWSFTWWGSSHFAYLVVVPSRLLWEEFVDAIWYNRSMLQSSWSGCSHVSLLFWSRKRNGLLCRGGFASCEWQIHWLISLLPQSNSHKNPPIMTWLYQRDDSIVTRATNGIGEIGPSARM